MEWTKDDFLITTVKDKIQVDYVHRFLSHSYWAQNIPIATLHRSISGSICFSVFHKNQQVGFARVITERPRLLTWLMFSLMKVSAVKD